MANAKPSANANANAVLTDMEARAAVSPKWDKTDYEDAVTKLATKSPAIAEAVATGVPARTIGRNGTVVIGG